METFALHFAVPAILGVLAFVLLASVLVAAWSLWMGRPKASSSKAEKANSDAKVIFQYERDKRKEEDDVLRKALKELPPNAVITYRGVEWQVEMFGDDVRFGRPFALCRNNKGDSFIFQGSDLKSFLGCQFR